MAESGIRVEVAYALPDRQRIVRLTVPEGTSMLEAVQLSRIAEYFPGLEVAACPMGIFGKLVPAPEQRALQDGERVEIYRPLIADPREVRRQRAARAREADKGS